MSTYTKIILPTRPQPDTIVAVFLLQTYGKKKFPGIETADIVIDSTAKESADAVLIDVGNGTFDHHGTSKCASELVAEHLGLDKDPALQKLIQYAARDDKYGKGTLSRDPIDRTFGLSGLIASLNKKFQDNPQKVFEIVLPLIDAHHHTSIEHHYRLPEEVEKLKTEDSFISKDIQNGNRNIRVAYIRSDSSGMAAYLRSARGGGHNVIVQKTTKGHVNLLTKQTYTIDLSGCAAMIRLREAELRNIKIPDEETLYTTGFHPDLNMWYYDPATNSLLNGGAYAVNTEPTQVPWEEIQKIIDYCLKEAKITRQANKN